MSRTYIEIEIEEKIFKQQLPLLWRDKMVSKKNEYNK